MEPLVVISLLGGIIIMLLIVGAPLKPLRFLGQIAIKFVIGALFLFFVNVFGTLIDFHVPINAVTVAVSGVLGLPGVVLLIAVKYFII